MQKVNLPKSDRIMLNIGGSFSRFKKTALTYEIIFCRNPAGGQLSYVGLIGCSFFTRNGARKGARKLHERYARSGIETKIKETT